MPKFSNTSLSKLQTCEPDLQTLFSYVILWFDCTVIYGHRSEAEQFELYKQGREFINYNWAITDINKVVTYKDGKNNKSKHNYDLSKAVDVAPYPTLYSDKSTIRHFAGFVLGVARTLKYLGYIDADIISGIDWDNDNDLKDQNFFDALHFEIL